MLFLDRILVGTIPCVNVENNIQNTLSSPHSRASLDGFQVVQVGGGAETGQVWFLRIHLLVDPVSSVAYCTEEEDLQQEDHERIAATSQAHLSGHSW